MAHVLKQLQTIKTYLNNFYNSESLKIDVLK